jgi:hypothetical protein
MALFVDTLINEANAGANSVSAGEDEEDATLRYIRTSQCHFV